MTRVVEVSAAADDDDDDYDDIDVDVDDDDAVNDDRFRLKLSFLSIFSQLEAVVKICFTKWGKEWRSYGHRDDSSYGHIYGRSYDYGCNNSQSSMNHPSQKFHSNSI